MPAIVRWRGEPIRGGTNRRFIGQNPQRGAQLYYSLPKKADKVELKIVDISGDGMANFGAPPVGVRDGLVKQGITINGLAILSEEPWLDDYYRQNVIGGPNAFLLVVQDFNSFADAMANKLAKEIDVAGSAAENRLSSLLTGELP